MKKRIPFLILWLANSFFHLQTASASANPFQVLDSTLQITGLISHESCAGAFDGSIDVQIQNASGEVVIYWYGSNGFAAYGEEDLFNLAAGEYQVNVVDSIGNSASQTFVINNQSNEAPSMPEQSIWRCSNNGPYSLDAPTAPEGCGFQWFIGDSIIPGATAQTYDAATSGYYRVAYSYPTGCPFSKLSNGTQINTYSAPAPYIEVTGNTLVVKSSGGSFDHVQWYFNNNPNPIGNQTSLTATQSGLYSVSVSQYNFYGSCFGGASTLFTLTEAKDLPDLQTFMLSPNPAGNVIQLRLSLADSKHLKISIADARGQVLQTVEQEANDVEQEFPLKGLPPGLYLLLIENEDGRMIRKFVH